MQYKKTLDRGSFLLKHYAVFEDGDLAVAVFLVFGFFTFGDRDDVLEEIFIAVYSV